MAAQTWIIIGLIILSWWSYTYPDIANGLVSKVWDPVNDFINLDRFSSKETECVDTIEKVCGSDGITYDNICKASKAGILSVTPGACEDEG